MIDWIFLIGYPILMLWLGNSKVRLENRKKFF